MAGERRSRLPYVPAGGGYAARSDIGRQLTFAYFQTASIEGNLVGDSEDNDLYLVLRPPGNRQVKMTINLTNLTGDELTALHRLVTTAINTARPVAEARDKGARDAFEAGDDSDPRLYRAAPTLSVRAQPLLEYTTRLQERLGGVPAVANEEPANPSE